ncbi:MAG: MBL fold metallo-hydrolase [Pseudomonadota bacterium]
MKALATVTLFALLILVLAGCSANSVTTIEEKSQPTNDENRRFQNLDAGEKSYPLTCKQDCYKPRSDIQCGSDGLCQYTGNKKASLGMTDFSVKWLGHAAFVIKTSTGETFLTDPVFDDFDWPINWLFLLDGGEDREMNVEPTPELIATTDAVLYSHLHYDHFNKSDIETIGRKPEYLVPLNMADHFPSIGANITELGWFSSKKIGQSLITAVPAHHFSSRTLVPFIYEDNNKDSWSAWLIESKGETLIFAGDTGYSEHFKTINERYGDIDVCLLPIASYYSEESPEWYRYVHMTPEDALAAADDLNCKIIIPWGYGNASWGMGDLSSHSALTRFLNMVERMGTSAEIVILNEGESL